MSSRWRIRATLRAIDVRDCRSPLFRTRAGVSIMWVVLCLSVWLPARDAHALELLWDGPAACPDRNTLLARIQSRRGSSDDAAWSVVARVTRTGSRYTLDLTLRGPN